MASSALTSTTHPSAAFRLALADAPGVLGRLDGCGPGFATPFVPPLTCARQCDLIKVNRSRGIETRLLAVLLQTAL